MDKAQKPIHPLHLLRTSLLNNPQQDDSNEKKPKYQDWQSYRNVQDLENAGIWLKPSKTTFLNNISYINCWVFGYLKLPQIAVDNSTGQKYFNLMAFEMCPDFNNNFEVTS